MQTLDGLERSCNISKLSQFIRFCFVSNSRQDRLVEAAHESLKECVWSSCLRELDACSNEERFELLDLLVAILLHLENEVSVTSFLTRPS